MAIELVLLTAFGPAALARTRKGDKYLKDGRLAETKRDFDTALDLYERALGEDPADAAYQLAARRVRFQAGQKHIDDGMKLRAEGKLEEAKAEFQKAYAIDPASILATQELKRTLRMIQESAGAPPGEREDRGKTPGETARDEGEKKMQSIQGAPELKPLSRQISTLKMNNQPVKVLFETLGKLAGVNVVFDPEYQSSGKNHSIDLTNVPMETGLDHLAVLTKTYWKPISTNTIFVTNDNVTKRRDYEDMVVKAFYIRNITTPQELQEIATVIRSVTDIRRVFTYNAQGTIILRGTVDQVVLAEKIISDLDKPKSEVIVDIYVMEVARTRTRDLAASLVSGGTKGLTIPVAFTPRRSISTPIRGSGSDDTGSDTDTGSSPTSSVTLANLSKITTQDFSTTLPGAIFQALMTDRGTKVLQQPQVRAVDSVKSSLKIGDRYPYATGSFQPGVGTVGVSPLVSTQFQFADVGVNVDITPKIHGADEVSLQVEIDLSNIRDQIDVGGLTQPVIGQRKLTHNVRMRQGEVSILGGLLQEQDTRSKGGVAGLASVPGLGRLFSGESVERSNAELVIALVPHIIRSPEINDINLRGIAAGTDQLVKLNYAPGKEAPKAVTPAAPGQTQTPQPPVEAAPPPDAPKPEAPKADPAKPALSAMMRLRFSPPKMEVPLSGAVTITLEAENATDLFGAPMRIQFDPKILRLNEVGRGGLMTGDGQQPIFSRNILNDRGEATVILNRLPGSTGVSGTGGLVTFTFQAIGKGATEIKVVEATLRNSQMQTLAAETPSMVVNVQ